ncbi:hypothetical protein PSTG_07852 [Puccinia striiformis f. sp. tritici PST-78]|uniref:Uncharacterized protein n=1 Tax=Puccinia striiformis f. sp. tritici PST-78 TaxID=1165861 RepID=A0A0L0VHS0_9BASI|nr:hypothetical protein PSTG_07852 [Puccinia striiformis f. sp. tritici PST-78]
MPRLRVWRLGHTSIKPAQGSSSRIVGSSEWLGVDAPAAAPTFGDPSIDANPVRPRCLVDGSAQLLSTFSDPNPKKASHGGLRTGRGFEYSSSNYYPVSMVPWNLTRTITWACKMSHINVGPAKSVMAQRRPTESLSGRAEPGLRGLTVEVGRAGPMGPRTGMSEQF